MLHQLCVLTTLAIGLSTPVSGLTTTDCDLTGISQCDALIAAGLRDQLLFPGDNSYEPRINSWWSASSRLRPWCIVQPRTVQDVSKVMRALSQLGTGGFAVRSGGHSHWTGGSNIENGITIDLGKFDEVSYVPGSKIASIGPGQRWGDVFQILESKGVAVAGGRDGNVGVGGLVTGGGNSYYTGRHGFACDTLLNAEVVLADGRIVHANAVENRDLWKALKGGSGNFGIVTRFDLEAFQTGQLWGGMRASNKSTAPEIIKALVNFTNNNAKNPEAAFLINFTYQPSLVQGELIVAHVLIDTDGVPKPSIFREVLQVPELFSDMKKRPMSGIANDYVLPSGKSNVWFTLTFKNDARVVQRAFDLQEAFVADLLTIIPANQLVAQSLFQPLPRFFSEIGLKKGGNVLGLDSAKDNSLLWLGAIAVESPEYEAIVRRKAAAMKSCLEQYAISINALVPWQYLNYADPSQNPLKSYGQQNLQFLRSVSRKYDPNGVFQNQVPGGFKLSRAE
ncbi:FAD-dependent monooxygenase sdcF [Cladobotryum mycophilum]|uniref:FAD-dependent monooxygenase sdcF n=1 Tax=Cladobotryum mycophilum TaxID=491253 RepID=A0ABR0SJ73_9HYPO